MSTVQELRQQVLEKLGEEITKYELQDNERLKLFLEHSAPTAAGTTVKLSDVQSLINKHDEEIGKRVIENLKKLASEY